MIEDLKRNIGQEKKILADMVSIQNASAGDSSGFYQSSLEALAAQLKMLNGSVPELLKSVSVGESTKKLESPEKPVVKKEVAKPGVVRMSYVSPSTKEKRYVTINKKDKKEFLKGLSLSEKGLSKIKSSGKETSAAITKPNYVAKISNKFFRKYSEKLTPKFDSLAGDLKRANIRFLTSTYISIAIFSTVCCFILGLVIFALLIVSSLSNLIYFWIPLVLAGFSLIGFYFYPAMEAGSVQKYISQELPFATIYMAAIAGSDIEPSKIFKIIASSKEYPNVGKEMRKVVNQVEIYGYDLVTALKNVAMNTSNKKLAELFGGLATNISTGGELKTYLSKKAENFLVDYKLERRKYNDLAGTFMDVYISILIAAPLIMMLMFVVMGVLDLGIAGFGTSFMIFLSIGIVAVANVIFLIVLNFKQPSV